MPKNKIINSLLPFLFSFVCVTFFSLISMFIVHPANAAVFSSLSSRIHQRTQPKLEDVQIHQIPMMKKKDFPDLTVTPASTLGYGRKHQTVDNSKYKDHLSQSVNSERRAAIEEVLIVKVDNDVLEPNQSSLENKDTIHPFNPKAEDNQLTQEIELTKNLIISDVTQSGAINLQNTDIEKHTNKNLTELNLQKNTDISNQFDSNVNIESKKKAFSNTLKPKNSKPLLPAIEMPKPLTKEQAQEELLASARQHFSNSAREINRSNQQTTQSLTANIPAFRNLMNIGVIQLKNNQLVDAEASFTHAQRMVPQSSAVYFYLGQVAIKKQQPRKAEAFARRGLMVSNDKNRKQSLWQVILKAGKMLGDKNTISEAKKALQ